MYLQPTLPVATLQCSQGPDVAFDLKTTSFLARVAEVVARSASYHTVAHKIAHNSGLQCAERKLKDLTLHRSLQN